MFSAEYYKEIKTAFDKQMTLLDERIRELEKKAAEQDVEGINDGVQEKSGAGVQSRPHAKLEALSCRLLSEKKEEILGILARCTEEETQALTFLYSAMPLSDMLDYPASLFLTYAKHGVFLWNQGPFAGRVPEKLFANYVLHYRVNNEDITETRGFFYDKVMEAIGDQVRSDSMYDTAIHANYWCAREATYRASDGRTQNPRTMYGVTMGRCGEESTFAVTVLRSMGIPARQIYAPLWTHCDDNHAWVELWCDGEWYFLGACEPEERLNRGWFIEPASRAVLLHSRWFGKDEPLDTQVGPKGMARVLNHLDRYAHTTHLTVKVKDEEGRPVPHARLDFQVLNHGEFGLVAMVYTGTDPENCGEAKLMTGFGDLCISASADLGTKKLYGESMISLGGLETKENAEWEMVLKEEPDCWEGWKDLDFHAPKPGHLHDVVLTPKQQQQGEQRLSQAAEYRQKKEAGFYDVREAERVLARFEGEDRAQVEEILHRAHGNMAEIVRFLEWDAAGWIPAGWGMGRTDHWKLEVLKAFREKDYWDTKAETLIDCCMSALPYAGTVPDEIFFRFLLCSRVSNEMLRPCRVILSRILDEDTKSLIRRMPEKLSEIVGEWMISLPEQEYENLITSPLGCMRGGVGSRHSVEVFCVNLYRSLGIPARLSFFDGRLEYYRDGKFTAADGEEESAMLILQENDGLKLSDWEHYSLERFEGDGFERLGLWGQMGKAQNGKLELPLRPGIYRILTTNRRKNGDQLARVAAFALKKGETREITLSMREIPVEDMLTRTEYEDFELTTFEGESGKLASLTGAGKALFLWLEVTREPTEHILNELYDRKEDFAALKTPLYVVLKSPEDLENATLRRTMTALPKLIPVLDDFGASYEKLAQSVGQEIGKLPLAVILEGSQQCIYSDAGYNVGMADALWRILV